jgi:PAS domain S-box-containing protein
MPEATMKIWLCAVDPELTAAILESPGDARGVFAAADPGEILQQTKARCPSVVVMGGASADVVADSCRTIRGAWTCRDAVIVAVSEGRPGEVGLLLEAGADDVFVRSSGDAILRIRLQVACQTAAEAASRRAHQDAREQFFELSTQLLCIVSDGYFSMVNPAWTQVLGWSAEELTSTPWIDFVHPDDRQASMIARSGVQAEPRRGFTNRYRCKDGSYRWFEWGGVLSVERDVIYAVVHDVTEARASKNALRKLSERLATTLDSIAGVSHEMNDPLAFVVANLDTALEEIRAMSGSSSATLRKIEKMLTDARAGAAAVTQIVGGLETFSRSEEERPQDVDLVALEPPSSAARRGAVLVVDDEPDVCAAIRRVLATHDVTIVNDGRSALELLATGKEFDVVLSDLLMPRMSGMALFQAIVDLHPGMAKRVVFITGGAFTPEAHTFLDRVRNERVAKPFDSKELRKTVQRFVG